MMKYIVFIFLTFFFISCQLEKTPERPNFIIFFSDELAPEYVEPYGGSIPTPAIDQLSETGVRFDQAYVAAPMCTPSRFSLITGKYPGRCVHPDFLESYPTDQPYVIAWNTYLEGKLPTLPGILSENGYFTGMAGKWHIGKIPDDIALPDLPEDATLDDPQLGARLSEYQRIVKEQVKRISGFGHAESVLWGNFDGFPIKSLRYHNFPWITYGSIKLLEQAKSSGKPFFLYLATTAVHGPGHAVAFEKDLRYTLEGKIDEVQDYALNADSMKNVLSSLTNPEQHKYAGISSLDNHINLILSKLRELGLDRNTVVLFMADHNVEPGKATCYNKGLHVPFILNWPGKFSEVKTFKDPVSGVDILPTLLEMADIPLPADSKFDGISFLPALSHNSLRSREYIYAESGLTRSVSNGKWKYIAFRYPDEIIEKMESGEIDYAPNFLNLEKQAHSSIAMEYFPDYFDADQLYNLEEDPYEQNNLAYKPEYQDKLDEMQDILEGILGTMDHPYDLSDTSFMRSEKYRELVQKSLSHGTDYIPWLSRDHGSIQWPPR